jgi:hypothetical protein
VKIGEGDRFKHKLTGQIYEVKIIKDDTFVLESADSPYRMWFGEGDLGLFFEMANRKKRVKMQVRS